MKHVTNLLQKARDSFWSLSLDFLIGPELKNLSSYPMKGQIYICGIFVQMDAIKNLRRKKAMFCSFQATSAIWQLLKYSGS